jgi:hypothetical protein
MWQWLLSILASLSADPAQIDQEAPRASAAVSVAYAATAQDKAPQPQPEPPKPKPAVCADCGGRGYIVHGDGHRTVCPTCGGKACPDGKCPPGASPASVSPVRPAGVR